MSKANPLFVMAVVVALSLAVAAVLFGILDSTGTFDSKGVRFGGAAAGFFATLVILQRWHGKLADNAEIQDENQALRSKLEKQAVPPDFKVPEGFLPYVALEESVAFCYPQEWRHEPQVMNLIFILAREQMSVGDPFLANANVMVQPTVQRQMSVGVVYALAEAKGMADETVAQRLGIPLSNETRNTLVDLPQILDLLGIGGDDFAERLYELDVFQVEQGIPGLTVRNETASVNGRKARFVERRLDAADPPLVQYQAITYVVEADATYTFTFTDNVEDAEKLQEVTRRVLDTVRFTPRSASRG